MKTLCGFLCAAVLLCGTVCLAQEESYREQVSKIFEAAQDLDGLLKTNTVDLTAYDKWYKDFSGLFTAFKKGFLNTHKQEASFSFIREAANTLALAWSKLNQAKYSDDQYKEFITLNNVGDAHKWKNAAIAQRKDALDALAQAIELIGSAENLLEEKEGL